MTDEVFKENILKKISILNKIIREMEDYAKYFSINIQEEKLYVVLCSNRKVLRDLLGGK
jgi:hypothetical protein